MGRVSRRVRIAAIVSSLLIAVLVTAPVAASGTPSVLRYEASWGGLHAGDLHARFDDKADGFRAQLDIRTVGLVRLLTRFWARGLSEAALKPDGTLVSRRYFADYQQRHKPRRYSLVFASKGEAVVAERGADDTSKPSPLGEEFRSDVFDPLALLAVIRNAIMRGDIPRQPDYRIPVFDGKRRFDAVIKSFAPKTVPWGRGTIEALRLELLMVPIAGFRPEKDGDEEPENKPRLVELLLTNDGRHIPLRIEVPIWYLPAVITFVGECVTQTPCKTSFE